MFCVLPSEVDCMNNTQLMRIILLMLCSCQAVSIQSVGTGFQKGIADRATGHRAGVEVGGLIGSPTFALDLGLRRDGDGGKVNTKQTLGHIGARVTGSQIRLRTRSNILATPFISAGLVGQRNRFSAGGRTYQCSSRGTYARLGLQFELSSSVSLDIAYEMTDVRDAQVGGRTGLDLKSDSLLIGFSLKF